MMSSLEIYALVQKVKQMGRYTGVRYLRNQGVPFALAHVIVLGCAPRFS